MIPNLSDITYGENKDITTFLTDWSTIHLAMSVLFRPIVRTANGTYEIEKYVGIADRELMRQMPLDVVLGANLFFYRLLEELLKAIPNYLEQVAMDHKGQMQEESSKQTGEAMKKSILLLRETLEGLKK